VASFYRERRKGKKKKSLIPFNSGKNGALEPVERKKSDLFKGGVSFTRIFIVRVRGKKEILSILPWVKRSFPIGLHLEREESVGGERNRLDSLPARKERGGRRAPHLLTSPGGGPSCRLAPRKVWKENINPGERNSLSQQQLLGEKKRRKKGGMPFPSYLLQKEEVLPLYTIF